MCDFGDHWNLMEMEEQVEESKEDKISEQRKVQLESVPVLKCIF